MEISMLAFSSAFLKITAFSLTLISASLMTFSVGAAPEPVAEKPLLSDVRQLILSGKRSGEGYFSANGHQLIFQSEREPLNPFFQIYLLDLTTGSTRRVSNGQGKTTCAWLHPDGKHALYASTHEDPDTAKLQQAELDFRASGKQRRYSWDYDPHYDIYRSDLEGSRPVNLTRTLGYDAEGSYSPDGQQIVFASNRNAYNRNLSVSEKKRLEQDPAFFMELYIMNSDGSNVRQLTNVPGYDGGPFFSPDGQSITFRRFNEAGDKAEIWTMKTDGSEQKQITRLGVMSWAPFYHPSGDYLIFATNRHGFGNFELYLVDAKGQKPPVRVTDTDGFDGLPVFSPDGQQLIWTSGRTGNGASQLFRARWNDEAARRQLGLPKAEPVPSKTSAQGVSTTGAAITAEDISQRVHYLASQALAGRGTGTPGELKATAYAAAVFKQLGLLPAGDNGSYFQTFDFVAGVQLTGANTLQSQGPKGPLVSHDLQKDFVPLVFSESGSFDSAEVVFAGYGLKAPANGDFKGYDSYVHLEVKDKWVVVLRYWPEKVSQDQQQELKRYANLRYKAMIAREQGAKGLLVVGGPNSPDQQTLVSFRGERAPNAVSIPALSVSNAVVAPWLQAAGQDLQAIQDRLDQGEFVPGEILPVRVSAQVELKKIRQQGRNVLARLPGSAVAKQSAQQTVVVGAHLDHLGEGHAEGSLARQSDTDLIHYGADDNASGSAGVLEIAEYMARNAVAPHHDVLFALWSGEELGLLGSNHFVETAKTANSLGDYGAYLNMDMVGRFEKALVAQGVGSSPEWGALLEQHNVAVGLPLVLQESAYLPTDATSFYTHGIPALSLFTGAHSDYHTPGDTADKLNYPDTARIVDLVRRLTMDLANRSEPMAYQKQAPPKQEQSRGLRVYLGTIPDYASGDIKGVKLSGVTAGSPAEKAGLKNGDIIVKLNGKGIENIYDYTYAIDTLTIGKAVPVEILRAGQSMVLSLTPGSRN
jgi:Tol biopolymer transport system component/Zn-dependent M28 family amino/carboxypeptidase